MECGEQCVAGNGIAIMPELCADNWGTVSIQVNWRWEYIWQCSLKSDVTFMVMDWSLPNLNFTNIFYTRFGAKPANLKTANLSGYTVASYYGGQASIYVAHQHVCDNNLT